MTLNQREVKIVKEIESISEASDSLLDVGCGEGKILRYLKNNFSGDIYGVEQDSDTLRILEQHGINSQQGDARKLPFDDSSVDWILLSNILHHIPNPQKAIDEAVRVSKKGIIISEGWYDTTIKSQQYGAEIDAFCKKIHQALGFFHRVYLNSGEIIALLSQSKLSSVRVNYGTTLIPCKLDYWLEPQKKYFEQLPSNHLFHWELKNLQKRLVNKPLCEPGWMIMTLKL